MIEFIVYAKAQPQGSIKSFENPKTGRIVSVSDNPKMKPYRAEVGWQAKRALYYASLHAPMAAKHVPVEVVLEFMFVLPKNRPKSRVWPVVKPDIDKLERATLDALTGILFADDAQVVSVRKQKVYGPREQVRISARVMTEGLLF